MKIRDLLLEVDVNSAIFKEWFSGSKVVDSSGQPLICYHGTLTHYEIKPAGEQHFGTFEAANTRIHELTMHMEFHPKYGKNYPTQPHIYPVYLKITNPLTLDDLGEWYDAEVINELYYLKLVDEKTLNRFREGRTSQTWMDVVKRLGYDGINYINEFEHAGSVSWYPFYDHQVWNIFADKPYGSN